MKNITCVLRSITITPKIDLKMKLTFILLLTTLLNINASGYSQKTKISLQLNDATVEKVFYEIMDKTDFKILYATGEIDLQRKVSIKVKNQRVEKVLDILFANTMVNYNVVDKQIVLVITIPKKGIVIPKNKIRKKREIQNEISGKVIDETGVTLPGVNIIIEGTTRGTQTNFDGFYTILADEGDILNFSYIGMKTQIIKVGSTNTINVTMLYDDNSLEEVIVVGYGTQTKKDMTGSVVAIKTEELLSNSPMDIAQGIQGKLAGVKISSDSGAPGSGTSISIRGVNSISAGTSPLYVIDGIPYDLNQDEIAFSTIGFGNSSNPLAAINPADIKSLSVLKDASATAIYGSRGANGVIIIETKKGGGANNEAVINFSLYSGFNKATRKIPVLNGNEFIEYRRDIDPEGFLFFYNSDLNEPRDPYELTQHDWQDEILRTGFVQNYDVSMRGKSDKTNYSASFGFIDNEAIIKNNDNQRYSFRLNLEHRKSDKLRIGVNASGSYNELNGATQSGGGSALFNGVVQNLVISTPVELYNPAFDPGDVYISPSSMIDDAYKKSASGGFAVNAFIHYDIGEDFKLIMNGGGNFSSSKGSEFYGKETNWGFSDNGYSNINESRAISVNGSAQLHYTKLFKEKHKINAFIASEMNNYNYESFSITKTNFLDELTGVFDISKGSTHKSSGSFRDNATRISFFGRVNYTFNEKHLFTLTYRADGSDKFGEGNRYGFFPSAAYSWVILDNILTKDESLFSFAKLRLSYGVTGNDRIPSYRYLPRLENTYYNGELGLAPSSQANENLQWETTNQYNFGFDFGFFDNAITASIDVYKKETHDLLMPIPVAGRSGYSSQWQNIGRIDNQGIEFQLSSINIDKNDFRWSTDFNISHNKNEIINLGGDVEFIPLSISGGWIQDIGRLSVGESLGQAYGYEFDGVYQISDFNWQDGSDPSIPHADRLYNLNDGVVSVDGVNVRPGSHKFRDLNGDGTVTLDDDRTHISQSDPILFGGLTNTFKYKNFDLNIFFQGSYGNEIFNESRYRLEGGVSHTYQNVTKNFYYNRWTPENPTNEYADFADRNVTSQISSSYYVEDASYIRLQSVSLGYSLDDDLLTNLKIKNARVYITGNNLFTWTEYSGYDPELNSGNKLLSGVDRIIYPRSKSILFGFNLTF